MNFQASLVRTDLPVPVYQTVTQTDFEGLGFNVFGRQDDTPTFRYYEIAGGSHNTVHEGIEIIPAGVFGPNPILLTDLCLEQLNTVAAGPVFASYVLNALRERMQEQIVDGDARLFPRAPRRTRTSHQRREPHPASKSRA